MEKKSFAIGGAIGTAVGMVAMLGIALGVGSCANKDKVKNLQEGHVLVQRPKKAVLPDFESATVWRLSGKASVIGTTYDGTQYLGGVLGSVYTMDYAGTYRAGLCYDVTYMAKPESVHDTSYAQGLFGKYSEDGTSYATLSYITQYGVGLGGYSTWYQQTSGYIYMDYVPLADLDSKARSYLQTCYDLTYGTITMDGSSGYVFTEGVEPQPEPVSGGLVSDIFNQVTASISNFAQALGNSVTQTVQLFYVDGNWTPLGILTLVSAGIALVYWCFYLIKKLLNIGVK